MNARHNAAVAVLLATYNGTHFIELQMNSLAANATSFTLHWLDDHSSDNTRELVRGLALTLNIDLCEWHQLQHQGVPGAFFQLLECVEADIYLFCDQDDIWQPGKIDATVANLLPDLLSPVLCFSDPFLFNDSEPTVLRRLTDVLSIPASAAVRESMAITKNVAAGHTMGFTRPLRELFLKHKNVARSYAFMHDWWMYLIAIASGTSRMLSGVPTTLYRIHNNNAVATYQQDRGWRNDVRVLVMWKRAQLMRRLAASNAKGVILASDTLPPGPKRDRMVALARLVAPLDRRRSPVALIRLVRFGALPLRPTWRFLWLAATCLCSDAKA